MSTRRRAASKFWFIAHSEYKRQVLQKSFVFIALSFPLVIALMVGLVYLVSALEADSGPLGYVDHSGLLDRPLPAPLYEGEERVPLIRFDHEDAAQAALDEGQIQAYYVVTAEYLRTGQVTLVYTDEPGDDAVGQFRRMLQINVASDLPYVNARRAAWGSETILRLPENVPGGGREFGDEPTVNDFLPLLAALAFIILVMSTSGMLLQAVVEEKENRTVELIVTSVSPGQLIGGKVLGIVAVGLTELLCWIAFALLAVYVGGQYLGIEALQDLQINPRPLTTLAATWIPAYVMVSALMTGVGATVAETQEGQQVTGLFILPFMLPFWLFAQLGGHPQGTLAVVLTFIPFTSPMTVAVRLLFSTIPVWQVVACTALLTLCAAGAIWLAGRAFRLGMLRYGQRLRWADFFQPEAAPREGAGHA